MLDTTRSRGQVVNVFRGPLLGLSHPSRMLTPIQLERGLWDAQQKLNSMDTTCFIIFRKFCEDPYCTYGPDYL